MSNKIDKARHAFGSEANIPKALADGVIDAYDILFLDEKKVGWVNKSGEVVIAEQDLSGLEAEIEKKADADVVEDKIDKAVLDVIDIANAYTDAQIETKIADIATGIEVIEF